MSVWGASNLCKHTHIHFSSARVCVYWWVESNKEIAVAAQATRIHIGNGGAKAQAYSYNTNIDVASVNSIKHAYCMRTIMAWLHTHVFPLGYTTTGTCRCVSPSLCVCTLVYLSITDIFPIYEVTFRIRWRNATHGTFVSEWNEIENTMTSKQNGLMPYYSYEAYNTIMLWCACVVQYAFFIRYASNSKGHKKQSVWIEIHKSYIKLNS